jgi:hypothetical protein
MFDKVVELIKIERARQDAKWGVQDHDAPYWLGILVEEVGELAKDIIEHRGIYLELVQVAAVAVAWLENLERINA